MRRNSDDIAQSTTTRCQEGDIYHCRIAGLSELYRAISPVEIFRHDARDSGQQTGTGPTRIRIR